MSSLQLIDTLNSNFSRRSRIEIMANILKHSIKSTRKTNILYKYNLSISQLKNYLTFLLEKGLLQKSIIEKPSTHEIYQTTNKGKKILKKFLEIKALLN